MKQGAERFSCKTENYSKCRPDFPDEMIEFLSKNVFDQSSVIADIGSGTGRFTRRLLEKGNVIYGVEQNNEMRMKAEELLSQYSNFISVAGSAERTGLASKSLDLITVAQAFHWFDKEKCLAEFKRIIKDRGRVLILWDDLVSDYNDFSIEYRNVQSKFRNVEPESKGKRPSRTEMISGFFKNDEYETMSFAHELCQDFERIKGGSLSASFAPNPDEENYEPFILELKKVFDKHQKNGKVCTAFRSVCYLGEI